MGRDRNELGTLAELGSGLDVLENRLRDVCQKLVEVRMLLLLLLLQDSSDIW